MATPVTVVNKNGIPVMLVTVDGQAVNLDALVQTVNGHDGPTVVLTAADVGAVDSSDIGQMGGPAGPLDASGKVPAAQLPPLQHDVGEAADQAAMLALNVAAPAMALRTDFTPPHLFMLTADPATDIANWHDTGELGAGGGDPSATVGLSAKNGVANTFMRSDGAPALDQSISPTWANGHTFGFAASDSVPSLRAASANPQFEISRTDAATDSKRWNWIASATSLTLRALNDAGVAASVAHVITRSGADVTEQQFWTAGVDRLAISATLINAALPVYVVQDADTPKTILAKSFQTPHDASGTLGISATYLGIGGGEWGANSYRLIGLGYTANRTAHYPAFVGYQEISTSSNTRGDLIFGARPNNNNEAPPVVMRIRNDGQILAENSSYAPSTDQSLTTKKYVDTRAPLPGADAGNNATYIRTVSITQANYDALATKDANTLYVIAASP